MVDSQYFFEPVKTSKRRRERRVESQGSAYHVDVDENCRYWSFSSPSKISGEESGLLFLE
jgi:hypothetical protein